MDNAASLAALLRSSTRAQRREIIAEILKTRGLYPRVIAAQRAYLRAR
jgi:hypothetical protein